MYLMTLYDILLWSPLLVGFKLTITIIVHYDSYDTYSNGTCILWWFWYKLFGLHVFHLGMGHISHDDVNTPLLWSCMYASKNEILEILFNILNMKYAYYIYFILVLTCYMICDEMVWWFNLIIIAIYFMC